MRVLAFDTASAACSVALAEDRRVIGQRFELCERGHAEILVPMIETVLREAGVLAQAVDRFAVTVGPGGFTGLRVGLATARGLALATGRPLIGLTTFFVIAHGLAPELRRNRTLVIAIDTRRGDLFMQLFDAGLNPLSPPQLLTADQLTPVRCAAWLPPGPLLVVGDGAALLAPALGDRANTRFAPVSDLAADADIPPGFGLPNAAVAATLIFDLPADQALPPRPLYLRAPDVTLPRERTA